MNISTSEYSSSGCESGWTTYLNNLSNSTDHNQRGLIYEEEKGRRIFVNIEEEEEEDLSMVSDASSGPPHYSYTSSIPQHHNIKNKTSKTKLEPKKKQSLLCLDDTATSTYSLQKNVPPKQDEGESITKKHLSFFKKGKSGSLLGRKRQ